MAENTETGLKSSRPKINVGGKDSLTLEGGLLRLAIIEDTGGLYRCEATFGNWGSTSGTTDFLYFDRSLLDFGKAFKIKLGADTLFDGKIMALEAHFPEGGSPEITVL